MKSQTMFKKLHLSALVLGLAGAATSAWATIETTSPVYVGASTTLAGNGGSGSRLTTFGLRMVQPIAFAGKISDTQNNTLTDTNATWADGQFGTSGTQAYVEYDNGVMVDVSNTSASSQSLTLAGSLSGIASVGDSYRVRPHMTIASLFGTNNETGLKVGTTASQADSILLQMAVSQATVTIFYFSNQFGHGWVFGNLQAADRQVIYPEEGVMVLRKVPGDLSLFTCGPVKTGITVVPIEPGYNLVGTLKSLNAVTLTNLNLYTGSSTTGMASGFSAGGSDNVLVIAPDGTSTTYFYHTVGGWVDGSLHSAANVPIAAGSAFFLKRLTADGPFNWTIPAE
jgi:hypothetical protein